VNVAILGTGVMGSAMARRLTGAGHAMRAWSRPLADAAALRPDGVEVCQTAREAARKAEAVITMAPDARAIEGFAGGPAGFLPALRPDAVWVQCSTVGLDGTERLARLARGAGVAFVDAPVLGTKQPAERGELVVLASGPRSAIDRCDALFKAIGRRTLRLGAAGAGTRMKLVANDWIVGCVAVLAETMALAQALDVDGELLLDAIAGSAVDMGYAQVKGRMMLEGSYPVGMSLVNAAKDARLVAEAAERHELPHVVGRAVAELLERGVALGDGAEDMAAAFAAAGARRKLTDQER
jgi:3-hydroxyisobutyrate dehydrogenase